MIKDKLCNAKTYYKISERLQKGFEWLKTADLKSLEDGRYEIDGSDIYANVQTYNTKEDAPYEVHRNYIDIQYMVSGVEKIGINTCQNCSTSIEYDKEKDIEFLDCNVCSEYLTLDESDFMVFFPQDAHQPALNYDKTLLVKKVVVKVKV